MLHSSDVRVTWITFPPATFPWMASYVRKNNSKIISKHELPTLPPLILVGQQIWLKIATINALGFKSPSVSKRTWCYHFCDLQAREHSVVGRTTSQLINPDLPTSREHINSYVWFISAAMSRGARINNDVPLSFLDVTRWSRSRGSWLNRFAGSNIYATPHPWTTGT